jgi:hypothetical protein
MAGEGELNVFEVVRAGAFDVDGRVQKGEVSPLFS